MFRRCHFVRCLGSTTSATAAKNKASVATGSAASVTDAAAAVRENVTIATPERVGADLSAAPAPDAASTTSVPPAAEGLGADLSSTVQPLKKESWWRRTKLGRLMIENGVAFVVWYTLVDTLLALAIALVLQWRLLGPTVDAEQLLKLLGLSSADPQATDEAGGDQEKSWGIGPYFRVTPRFAANMTAGWTVTTVAAPEIVVFCLFTMKPVKAWSMALRNFMLRQK
jgi:hypothetical protein